MTALGQRIAALIAASGPITVADYMAFCLGDPEHGYYMAREPFGRDGDFITAPEVSQMFGELIGLWAVATFEGMGSPSAFILAELGPGRGTLMADLLRAARLRPAFLDAAQIHLVESSPRLRAVQAATLSGVAATWHFATDTLPPGPMILVANEFFDALPIRQYVRTAEGWAERMVGLDEAGKLAFGLRPLPPGQAVQTASRASSPSPAPPAFAGVRDPRSGRGQAHSGQGRRDPARPAASPPSPSFRPKAESITDIAAGPEHNALPQGSRWTPAFSGVTEPGKASILEIAPAAAAIMSTLATRIAAEGGAALVIDYGYEGPAFGDTLQAMRGHAPADPLADPGAADLTAHVDFAALARAAAEAVAEPRPLITQSVFLQRLGIAARAERLAAGKDAATRDTVAAAVARLTAPEAMGDLFKVFALSQSGLALPAFDDDVEPSRGGVQAC